MNFLAMVKKVCRKVGYTEPSTLVDPDQDTLLVMEWIQDAWEEIQNFCAEWSFLKEPVTINILIDKEEYTSTELSLTDLRRWLEVNPFLYESGGSDVIATLVLITSEEMDYLRAKDPKTGQPIYYSPLEGGGLVLYPTPDAAYTFKTKYYQTPVILEDDTDEPACNSEHHRVIVDKVYQTKYAVDENNPEVNQQSEIDFENRINRLALAHCPQISMQKKEQLRQ